MGKLFLIGGEIFRPFLIAMRRPCGLVARESGEGDVKIVRRPAHQPDGKLSDLLKAFMSAQQVVLRARHDMGQADRLSRIRIGAETGFGIVEL